MTSLRSPFFRLENRHGSAFRNCMVVFGERVFAQLLVGVSHAITPDRKSCSGKTMQPKQTSMVSWYCYVPIYREKTVSRLFQNFYEGFLHHVIDDVQSNLDEEQP